MNACTRCERPYRLGLDQWANWWRVSYGPHHYSFCSTDCFKSSVSQIVAGSDGVRASANSTPAALSTEPKASQDQSVTCASASTPISCGEGDRARSDRNIKFLGWVERERP